MLFNAIKAVVMISAANLAVEASALQRKSFSLDKRRYVGSSWNSQGSCGDGYGNDGASGCGKSDNDDYDNDANDGYESASPLNVPTHGYRGGHVQAPGGIQAMVQGWSTLITAFKHVETTFSSHASVDVAVQAATSLQVQMQTVIARYSSCGCTASAETSAAFEQMASQFFQSMQLCLEAGQRNYGAAWGTRFQPIFVHFSAALNIIEQIAVSLHVNLAATLQRAHLNAQLFAVSGLNLSALLKVNLAIGGLIHL